MRQFTHKEKLKILLSFPVIVAALGYFVDIYDLLLFGIVRVPSLEAMGLNVDTAGTFILNSQMIGLLAGGILWGILGDKKPHAILAKEYTNIEPKSTDNRPFLS